MTSPWVKRAQAEARKSNHQAKRPVEPTLGDRVPADKARPPKR